MRNDLFYFNARINYGGSWYCLWRENVNTLFFAYDHNTIIIKFEITDRNRKISPEMKLPGTDGKRDESQPAPAFKPARVMKHLLFWVSILSFFSVFHHTMSGDPIILIAIRNLLYLPHDIILVYIIIGYLIPNLFVKKRFFLFSIFVILVFLANLGISYLIDEFIRPVVTGYRNDDELPMRFFYSTLVFSFIAGLASVIKLIGINNSIMLKKEGVEARFHKAELELLRSQINPHFLFNVFNNIDELIYKDRDKASEVLSFLSDSLRYVLQESNSDFVALEDEISFLRSYIEVASISFADPGFISFNFDGNCTGRVIAPMIFIPFIENTIKHCDRRGEMPGIEISVACNSGSTRLICRNRIKADKLNDDARGGFGLANVRKRLNMIYGERSSLDIFTDSGWYIADLTIYN